MKKSFKRFMQCAALSLGVMCADTHSMTIDPDLVEPGIIGDIALSTEAPQRDIENQYGMISNREDFNYFSAHIKLSSLGAEISIYDKTTFSTRICMTAACVAGGCVTLHLFGVM